METEIAGAKGVTETISSIREDANPSPKGSKADGAAVDGHCVVQRPNVGPGASHVKIPSLHLFFVKTPKAKDAEGKIIPPPGWDKNKNYAARWESDFPDDLISLAQFNSTATELEEVGWPLAAVRGVSLALYKGEVLEILSLAWKPHWVPLTLVDIDTKQLADELKVRKSLYNQQTSDSISQMNRTIEPVVRRVLTWFEVTEISRWSIRQINKYSEIRRPGTEVTIPVIKADFTDSFEHSSMLLLHRNLWKELYQRRIRVASDFLQKNNAPIMRKFKEKAEKMYEVLS